MTAKLSSAISFIRPAVIAIIGIACAMSACAKVGDVKPWEKAHLAKHQMAFDPDSIDQRYAQHIYSSKESSAGGYGVGGGGCGCN